MSTRPYRLATVEVSTFGELPAALALAQSEIRLCHGAKARPLDFVAVFGEAEGRRTTSVRVRVWVTP